MSFHPLHKSSNGPVCPPETKDNVLTTPLFLRGESGLF